MDQVEGCLRGVLSPRGRSSAAASWAGGVDGTRGVPIHLSSDLASRRVGKELCTPVCARHPEWVSRPPWASPASLFLFIFSASSIAFHGFSFSFLLFLLCRSFWQVTLFPPNKNQTAETQAFGLERLCPQGVWVLQGGEGQSELFLG